MTILTNEAQIIATQAAHTATLAAIVTAVQAIPGANNQAVLDALGAAKLEIDGIQAVIGTESPTVPAATSQPTEASPAV